MTRSCRPSSCWPASSPIPVLRVILVVTFGGLPQVIMDGIIEHHEVVPDATQGSSKLVVSGHDLSALMNLIAFDGLPYPGMSPDLRVLTILAKYAAFGIVPEVVPVPAPDIPVPVQRIPAQKGTDLAYVQHLAREAGYVFYITPGPLPGMNQAYWGPQVRVGHPAAGAQREHGFLDERREPHLPLSAAGLGRCRSSTSRTRRPACRCPSRSRRSRRSIRRSAPSCRCRRQIRQLHDTAKRSPAEALMLGMAEAVKNADVVTGDGTLDVDRYGQVLRARSLVGVRGAGLAFDGMHYVDSTTHNLKPGEYKQKFVLKRNALIADLPVVPALPY